MDKKEFKELMNSFNKLINIPVEIPTVGFANDDYGLRMLISPRLSNPTEEDLLSIIYLADVLELTDDINNGVPETIIFADNVCDNIDYKYDQAFGKYEYFRKEDEELKDIEEKTFPKLFLRLDESIFTEKVDDSDLQYSVEDFITSELPKEMTTLDEVICSMLDKQVDEMKKGNTNLIDYRSDCDSMIRLVDQACDNLLNRLINEVEGFINDKIDSLIPIIEYDYRIEALAEINHAKYVLENAIREFINDVASCNRNIVKYRLGNIEILLKHLR